MLYESSEEKLGGCLSRGLNNAIFHKIISKLRKEDIYSLPWGRILDCTIVSYIRRSICHYYPIFCLESFKTFRAIWFTE